MIISLIHVAAELYGRDDGRYKANLFTLNGGRYTALTYTQNETKKHSLYTFSISRLLALFSSMTPLRDYSPSVTL